MYLSEHNPPHKTRRIHISNRTPVPKLQGMSIALVFEALYQDNKITCLGPSDQSHSIVALHVEYWYLSVSIGVLILEYQDFV